MANAVCQEEAGAEVGSIAGLPTMRPEGEGVQTSMPPQSVERSDVGIHVVHPVRIRWIRLVVPLVSLRVLLESALRALGLVVHRVEADNLLQHEKDIGMPCRIHRRLEERTKDVVYEHPEVADCADLAEDRVESRDLNQPSDLLTLDVILSEPEGELGPLVGLSAVDRYAPLRLDVVRLLVRSHDVLCEFGQETAFDVVVRLEEDLSHPGIAEGVVLRVEAVEATESVVDAALPDGGVAAEPVRVDVVVV
mmetsp:Transcript_34801/g.75874  ORF Transcript_34801/g.75874 Transcript_34801/m.75874 type:complete len:250 (+) Transcript_34801:573-1322(+)